MAPRTHVVSWCGSGHLRSTLRSLVGPDPWFRTFEISQTLRRLEETGSWEILGDRWIPCQEFASTRVQLKVLCGLCFASSIVCWNAFLTTSCCVAGILLLVHKQSTQISGLRNQLQNRYLRGLIQALFMFNIVPRRQVAQGREDGKDGKEDIFGILKD